MTVTIETVNGKLHTVVWHIKPPECYSENQHRRWATTHGYILQDADFKHVATALKAVPCLSDVRRDERLWYAYLAEGIQICGKFNAVGGDVEHEGEMIEFPTKWYEDCNVICEPVEVITHGVYMGQKIKIAIEGEK